MKSTLQNLLSATPFHPFQTSVRMIAVLAVSGLVILNPIFSSAHEGHDNKNEENAHDWEPKPRPPLTAPAAHYSGATPIDRTNGNFFNVGTYGKPNPEYEQWAQSSTWAVGMAERPYSYDDKDHFVDNLDERIRHFEAAVWNFSHVSEEISKPEGKAYGDKAAAELNPRIEKARSAWNKAKSSGRGDWEASQTEAKRAFLELQTFYYGLHKNVH